MMEYTFFNITNPWEVLLLGGKPVLDEIGPFVYNQMQLRSDVEFNKTMDTVQFRQQMYQVFDAEETNRRTKGRFQSDRVKFTSVNILFQGMKAIVGIESWHLINDVTLWSNDFDRLFASLSVYDLIEGYKVNLKVAPGINIPIAFPGLSPGYKIAKKDPEYKYKNTIIAGRKHLSKTNELIEWGPGKTHSAYPCPWGMNPLVDCSKLKHNPCCGERGLIPPWGKTEYPDFPKLWNADANRVQGTLGDAFRPWLKRSNEEKVIVWSDQLGRALQFHNADGRTVNHHGIELLRFVPTKEFWQNATVFPPNARFYQHGPLGLVNASVIYEGAPIFASLPHFLYADPSLLLGVEGLNPNPALHELFLDVEPHTGMTFREHNRIQINCFVQREKWGKDSWFKHLQSAYIPIGYFDAHSEINHVGVSEFLALYNGMTILYFALAVGSICMCLTLCAGPIFAWFKLHHRNRKSRISSLRERTVRDVHILEDDGSLSPATARNESILSYDSYSSTVRLNGV